MVGRVREFEKVREDLIDALVRSFAAGAETDSSFYFFSRVSWKVLQKGLENVVLRAQLRGR